MEAENFYVRSAVKVTVETRIVKPTYAREEFGEKRTVLGGEQEGHESSQRLHKAEPVGIQQYAAGSGN